MDGKRGLHPRCPNSCEKMPKTHIFLLILEGAEKSFKNLDFLRNISIIFAQVERNRTYFERNLNVI